MGKKLFIFPKFSFADEFGIRLGGAGLGNLLFAFSRAVIYSHKSNIPLINPTWPSLKVGPYLRFEKDKRSYTGLFDPIGINGFKKYILLNSMKHLPESILENGISQETGGIIYVSGLKNYFQDLKGYHNLIYETLISIIKNKHLRKIESYPFNCVGIHLRLGDYPQHLRLSNEWCIQKISQIRKFVGQDIKVLIFTDGTRSEISEILALPNTERADFGSSISDIIALSRCKILIASDSTFSGWASYLGRMPVIYKTCHFTGIYELAENCFEGEIADKEELPPLLMQNLRFLNWCCFST
jgi:hypothetical protein